MRFMLSHRSAGDVGARTPGWLGAIALLLALPSPLAAAECRDADPVALQQHVDMLASELSPRGAYTEQLDPVARYIHKELSRYGTPVYQEVPLGLSAVSNIELSLAGTSEETLIVGAHYDAYNGYPGADDNASGVAGLLEIARLLSTIELPVTVVLVAYALEEPPHFATPTMGSARHARSSSMRSPVPFAMLNLEMIGYFCDEPKCQRYPLPLLGTLYPNTGNFIAAIGRRQDRALLRTIRTAFEMHSAMPVETLALALPGASLSDHRNYWQQGIHAVMITDTAFQRNPNYHTPDDTPDTLDYARMAMVIDGTCASVLALGAERSAR